MQRVVGTLMVADSVTLHNNTINIDTIMTTLHKIIINDAGEIAQGLRYK